MQRTLITLVGAVIVLTLQHGAAQVAAIDTEQVLTRRFSFTPAEVTQARSGQAVVKILPSSDSADIGIGGAVRIGGDANRLSHWLTQVTAFRQAAELGNARRLSNPPQLSDFADLSLDPKQVSAIKACRPGDCDLMIGDRAIQRFQTEVNWTAPDAATRATAVMRQLLLEHAQAYLKGGDQALGAAHNEKAPKVVADEFHQVLWQSKGLYELTPAFAAYLEGFPTARLPESEQFLYWAKGGVSEASISLHQMVIYRPASGDVIIADKQLYASLYVDAALVVISLAPAPGGSGYYALVGGRARSAMLRGTTARVLRGRVESVARETATGYLNWLRASLAL